MNYALDDPDARNHTRGIEAHRVHYIRSMYDLDAIEAINFEQLATVTDRLLLRGPKRPPAERTIYMRAAKQPWRRFTITALLTALFSVSAAIVVLL